MNSSHYPRQQQMKSEQGGARWYPAHKTTWYRDMVLYLSHLRANFLRHMTFDKIKLYSSKCLIIKYLDMSSSE